MNDEAQEVKSLRQRYVLLFGVEQTDAADIDKLERLLRLILPNAFKEIATFYRGGIVGGISHHANAVTGPVRNIFQETERIRRTADLPLKYVVLAEPPESLIVLDTHSGEVTWLDAVDIHNVGHDELMHEPQHWKSYAYFFEHLLKEEEEDRV